MYFRIKKKNLENFDDYIKGLISDITGFEKDKIIVNVAYKSNYKVHNKFDCFDFYYKNKVYGIEKGKLIPEKYI